MTAEVRREFEKLERQKESVLSGVSGWSSDQLSFRPQANNWSTLDVLDHLVKVERAFLRAERMMHKRQSAAVGARDRLMAWLVIGVMKSPLRVKVPAASTAVLPGSATDLPRITNEWEKTRKQMAKMFSSLAPEQIQRGIFRHPVSGWMTPVQAIRFLSAHMQHHGYQLNRLKRAVGQR